MPGHIGQLREEERDIHHQRRVQQVGHGLRRRQARGGHRRPRGAPRQARRVRRPQPQARGEPDAREVGKIGRSGGSVTKPEKVPCTDPKEIHAQNLNLGLTKHTLLERRARRSRSRRMRQPAISGTMRHQSASSARPSAPWRPRTSTPASRGWPPYPAHGRSRAHPTWRAYARGRHRDGPYRICLRRSAGARSGVAGGRGRRNPSFPLALRPRVRQHPKGRATNTLCAAPSGRWEPK